MTQTLEKKSEEIKKIFEVLSKRERYDALIKMGCELPIYPENLKTPDRVVHGCQSVLYLDSSLIDGKLLFKASADALISKGLAALLIFLYSGETPEIILTHPPTIIHELGIASSLSLNRSNGFAHIHLRMKQIALQTYKSGPNNLKI